MIISPDNWILMTACVCNYGTWRYIKQMLYLPTCLENIHAALFYTNFSWIRLHESEWVILLLAVLHKVQHTLVSCCFWERLMIDRQAAKNEQNQDILLCTLQSSLICIFSYLWILKILPAFKSVEMSQKWHFGHWRSISTLAVGKNFVFPLRFCDCPEQCHPADNNS